MSALGNKKRSIGLDASIESQFQILQTIARNQLLQFRSWGNQLGQNIMSNYAAIHRPMPLWLIFTISATITVLFLVSLKRQLFTNLTHLAIFDPIMTFRFTGGHISPWVEDSESSVLCLQMKDHQYLFQSFQSKKMFGNLWLTCVAIRPPSHCQATACTCYEKFLWNIQQRSNHGQWKYWHNLEFKLFHTNPT